ncbi:xanthine dehydrogenase accessory factor [Halopolyspora algeriensis]|uniref:Xanthine dehydrogenase accessory factor n=1 Tax=Halopolyspora algeriensis TaxID=1500506 RepID=A0A368VTZ3_9ACTN|nr:XdhC/CoxI family protein [Halopolyspora algeriensis]RCW42923.1 xanthine dehydrogenase accessory factor [Halopolyspora algeriensis]TQM56608.1 xanthine dehydrogenase accessory factor [Halopolyspora algeriensis]
MRDIAGELLRWAEAGESFAVASVISVRGSAPRGVGAALAVRSDGTVVGSLSGGCIEGSVHALALESLDTGLPVRSEFDYDPDDPFAVGLTCGGRIDVHIQPVDPHRDTALLAALRAGLAGEPVALARVLETGATLAVWPQDRDGSTAEEDLDDRITVLARAMLEQDVSDLRRVCLSRSGGAGPDGRSAEHAVFVESWSTPPRMLIFGAIDHAAALARQGRFLGYRVTVCDARAVFTTPERFPDADEVVVRWPHEYLVEAGIDARTVICVLTHDAKFDVPVLREALRSRAAYIGALGSRRTHTDRLRRLREAGSTEEELSRLRAPIGLDLGARTPEETAVSIAAEIITARTGTSARPLTHTTGPIHAHA